MAKNRVKVAVTGAAGQIGYAMLFRIAAGEMLGKDTEVDLSLIEIEPALPALEGVVMELQDCAFPLLRNITITSDINEGFKDANWCILVGSAPRKAGMERSDLLSMNGKIFTAQGKAINDNAADDVRVFVVGNPCNTNALIAQRNAPDIPADRFFAMTMLDEKRARAQLALKAGVQVADVKCMNIWGNHSSTQYPDFYHATIDGRPVTDVITDESWLKTDFLSTVQQRGAAVIKARGASSAASAANAAISSVYNLVHDTPEGERFSVGMYSEGEYGIERGLIFSYPCCTKEGQLHVVESLTNNEFSLDKIKATEAELIQEREIVKELGLID